MRQGTDLIGCARVAATPSRRTVLAGALAAGCGAAGRARAAAPPRWTIPYGAAVSADRLAEDAAFRSAILKWCSVLTPEGGLKWADIRPTRDAYRFASGDAYVAFATAHGLGARGHCLVWADAMPDWTRAIDRADAAKILTDHIATVAGRYAGRIASWDVVNEPMAPAPSAVGDLRPSVWLAAIGPAYLDLAFRAAAAADPSARLVINDYDIGYATPTSRMKRDGFFALVAGLVARGVPVHAVGLQGHLHGDLPIDRAGLSAFVKAVQALGLDVLVTELDVIDDKLPGPPAERDRAAADQVDAFLGSIFAAATPRAVLTWGVTDRFTWVPQWFKRPDGLSNRPLPLDADYRPKPMMGVIERYCR